MTYTEINQADALTKAPAKLNENFRQGRFLKFASKTADFTVWTDDTPGAPRDVYLVDATAGAVTVTLPAVAGTDPSAGRAVTVIKSDSSANAVTIDADGAETINGAATLVLASQYDRARIASDGTEWWRVD